MAPQSGSRWPLSHQQCFLSACHANLYLNYVTAKAKLTILGRLLHCLSCLRPDYSSCVEGADGQHTAKDAAQVFSLNSAKHTNIHSKLSTPSYLPALATKQASPCPICSHVWSCCMHRRPQALQIETLAPALGGPETTWGCACDGWVAQLVHLLQWNAINGL